MPVADEVAISDLDQIHRWERHALDPGASYAHPAIFALTTQRVEPIVEVANAVLAADDLVGLPRSGGHRSAERGAPPRLLRAISRHGWRVIAAHARLIQPRREAF